ncbi:MAG: hypothetical protein MJ142_00970 [Clostridia bacterium]|nr:hypothetical protein [Clostridia bacterium]
MKEKYVEATVVVEAFEEDIVTSSIGCPDAVSRHCTSGQTKGQGCTNSTNKKAEGEGTPLNSLFFGW